MAKKKHDKKKRSSSTDSSSSSSSDRKTKGRGGLSKFQSVDLTAITGVPEAAPLPPPPPPQPVVAEVAPTSTTDLASAAPKTADENVPMIVVGSSAVGGQVKEPGPPARIVRVTKGNKAPELPFELLTLLAN